MKNWLTTAALALLILAASGTRAISGDCSIDGTIAAARNTDPSGPLWVYTLTVDWDTGTKYALSHISLLLDAEGGTCSCGDFETTLFWDPVIGSSTNSFSCPVDFKGYLGCNGDPSIPGVGGITLKFEPLEGEGCGPGTAGRGVFTFYSNLGPAPIDENILSLVDKYSRLSCFGHLRGFFPAMPCDPVSAESSSWGRVKGLFR
jgi:hypothetical protein